MKYIFYVLGLFAFALPLLSFAQCAIEEIDIDQRFARAEVIVEGKISEQYCFEDAGDGHIYTANTIEVYKVFKGEICGSKVKLITKGGFIGDRGESLYPSLQVQTGNIGMFFLYRGRPYEHNVSNSYSPYAGPQSMISYDVYEESASDAFRRYGEVNELYKIIGQLSYSSAKEIAPLEWPSRVYKSSPNIDSISPKNASAGTKSVLNVYGFGFGNVQGSGVVEFRNASTGPTAVYPAATEYLSWTDTLISVEIPYTAGSGTIRVVQGGSDIVPGLVIRFAQLALPTSGTPIPTVHLDNNGSGGFTWQMANDFSSNSGARQSFERALDSWSSKTCMNWKNGPSTTVDQDLQDQTNNVRFANSGELETGVLAVTRNYWTNCNSATAYTVEIDMSFDPDKNWYTGSSLPSFNQYDIESVSVHELGHAHQLGHVINIADFMHATLGPGSTKRNLIDNDIEGGLYVMKKSVVKKPCGPTEMMPKANCTVPVGIAISKKGETWKVYPNPSSGIFYIKTGLGEQAIMSVYNNTGALVNQKRLTGQGVEVWQASGDLPEGLYHCRIVSENRKLQGHFILKR